LVLWSDVPLEPVQNSSVALYPSEKEYRRLAFIWLSEAIDSAGLPALRFPASTRFIDERFPFRGSPDLFSVALPKWALCWR
jgi:hypothetical protein